MSVPTEMTAYVPATPETVDNESHVPAVATSDDPILAAILAAARDPQVDIEKFRALKAMYDEERAYHDQREFNEAFSAAQSEMEPVIKDRKNTQTKSNYATIEAIAKAITPIYTKHGFAMSFSQCDAKKGNHLGVACVLSRGSVSKHYQAEVPIDAAGMQGTRNKTDTHAYGSTMHYGRRYLKLSVWDIATQDADDDGNAAGGAPIVPTITEEQAVALRELVKAAGRTEDTLVDGHLNPRFRRHKLPTISSLDDLPADAFASLVQHLRELKQKQAGKEIAND